MAGRGRGRGGKSSMSFDVGRLGFGSGEALPKANVQPPALYPPLQSKTTPLSSTEVDEYLLALSQEYRGSIKDSQFYLKPKIIKKDIVRYTDRYKQNQTKTDEKCTWEPDWNFVPKELKPAQKRKSNKFKGKVDISAAAKRSAANEVDVVKKLETLEKIASKVDSKGEKEDGENEENEEIEEEEYEDDNDYNFDYYDDGGDKYGDDDDGEEGPVY